MSWAPFRGVAKSAWSASGKSILHGRFSDHCFGFPSLLVFPLTSFIVKNTSGIMFFILFFLGLNNSKVFLISKGFSRRFLSAIAAIYFDIDNLSAEIVLKLRSFSISISRLRNSSEVFSSVCFSQKKSPRDTIRCKAGSDLLVFVLSKSVLYSAIW